MEISLPKSQMQAPKDQVMTGLTHETTIVVNGESRKVMAEVEESDDPQFGAADQKPAGTIQKLGLFARVGQFLTGKGEKEAA